MEDDRVDVVLGQEVPTRKKSGDTVGGGAGSKFWKVWGGGRAAIWVHKRWPRTAWKPVMEEGDVVGIDIKGTLVYSVYSPCYTREWDTPITTLARAQRPDRAVVGDDFNLHHPVWSGEDRHSAGAEKLLELAEKCGLELVTTAVEPTWNRHGCGPRLLTYSGARAESGGTWEWAGSDHSPQAMSVWGAGAAPRAAPSPNWKMMDPEEVSERVQCNRLLPISSKETLDNAADDLVRRIEIQKDTVPMTKVCKGKRSKAFW